MIDVDDGFRGKTATPIAAKLSILKLGPKRLPRTAVLLQGGARRALRQSNLDLLIHYLVMSALSG